MEWFHYLWLTGRLMNELLNAGNTRTNRNVNIHSQSVWQALDWLTVPARFRADEWSCAAPHLPPGTFFLMSTWCHPGWAELSVSSSPGGFLMPHPPPLLSENFLGSGMALHFWNSTAQNTALWVVLWLLKYIFLKLKSTTADTFADSYNSGVVKKFHDIAFHQPHQCSNNTLVFPTPGKYPFL